MDSTQAAAPALQEGWKGRFFTIWGGQALSLLGSQLVQFAIIWHLTTQTGSAITLTTATLAGLLPQVLLSPLIGTLVDRWNRRLILIVADGCVAASTVVLALLFASGQAALWHIYALLVIRAIGGGFHQSAMGASMVLLVPKEMLARVQGLNQALNGGLNVIAAPLGAFLLAVMPIQGILAIDAVTALFAIASLLVFSIPQPKRTSGRGSTSLGQDLREGLDYIRGWPALVIILGMVMVINLLLTPIAALLPLLVTRHFGGQALQLGLLEAAASIGIILGGVLLGVWGGFRRRVVTAFCGLVGLGAGVILTGLASAELFVVTVAGTALTGLMTPITNGSIGAVLQASIAPEMQGRVFALIFTLATAMSPLGLLLAGPAAELAGVRLWLVTGGVVCLVMGVAGFFIPVVMRFEERS